LGGLHFSRAIEVGRKFGPKVDARAYPLDTRPVKALISAFAGQIVPLAIALLSGILG
jgi:hypothetical protein